MTTRRHRMVEFPPRVEATQCVCQPFHDMQNTLNTLDTRNMCYRHDFQHAHGTRLAPRACIRRTKEAKQEKIDVAARILDGATLVLTIPPRHIVCTPCPRPTQYLLPTTPILRVAAHPTYHAPLPRSDRCIARDRYSEDACCSSPASDAKHIRCVRMC